VKSNCEKKFKFCTFSRKSTVFRSKKKGLQSILHLLINALNQPEVEVVSGLFWSPGIVYEYQFGRICPPHLSMDTWTHTGDMVNACTFSKNVI